ncbi:MAG: hypothetical protein HC788_13235 [Sphingopyxis sp.]|nr:hypothetical protein [Sphingopyxis sp.]
MLGREHAQLVVDLSRYLPGPLTSRLLADLGARVIKVEEPRLGDPVRFTPPRMAGQSASRRSCSWLASTATSPRQPTWSPRLR